METREKSKMDMTVKMIDDLNEEAWKIHITQPKRGLELAQQAKKLAEENKYERGRAYALRNMGVSYRYLSELETALTLSLEARSIFQEVGDKSGEGQACISIGAMYYYIGDYEKQLDYSMEGIAISEEAGNKLAQAYGNNTVGYHFGVICGEHEKGLAYMKRALDLSKEAEGALDLQPRLLDCMAEIYLGSGQVDKALEVTEQCLDLCDRTSQKILKSDALFQMGKIFLAKNKPEEAKNYFLQCLDLSIELGYKIGDVACRRHLGKIALRQHLPEEAKSYFLSSLEIAEGIKAKADIFKAHEALSELYEYTGDMKLFVQHYKLFHKYRTEVFREEQENRQKYLNIQHDMEKLKQEAEINRLTNVVMKEKNAELEKKTAELEQSYNSVSVLSKIGQEITSTLNLDIILNTVYESVNDLMDAGIFGIGIYNAKENTIDYRLAIENGQRYKPYSRTMEDKNQFPVWCIENQKEIFISDVRREYSNYISNYEEPEVVLEDGTETTIPISLMYLPLVIKGNVFGLLTVQSVKPAAYSSHHLDILKTLGSYAAAALYNAQSFETLTGTLNELKLTQQQLVQSEKMASLGELTAGIAHEIQNPLNFVNNFSEVSCEMIDELQVEINKGQTADALGIATNLKSNLEKIVHHGKRADSIVKGMLQHSQSSSGEKQMIDINALVDEYLRLSYHGLRARDKSFNCIMETHFDPSISKIEIIPQEIGRVFLNLFNNAFYSMSQKKQQSGKEYAPLITVSTDKTEHGLMITVKDNGMGIPKKVVDKIYQPFFTTKPTGEGTGLGLSLSYDIITKGHGGSIRVDSTEKEGANFIIELPG